MVQRLTNVILYRKRMDRMGVCNRENHLGAFREGLPEEGRLA